MLISALYLNNGAGQQNRAEVFKSGAGLRRSCFPKDTKALVNIGKKLGCLPMIVNSTVK